MQIQPISFKANITNGKKEFQKLSKTKQIAKEAIESFRQNYDKEHFSHLNIKSDDLSAYVRFRIAIKNAIKEYCGKFKK